MTTPATITATPVTVVDSAPARAADVARAFRCLASETNREVLSRLAAGQAEPAVIAGEIGVSVSTVRRSLRSLAAAGLVSGDARPAVDQSRLAQQAVSLVYASLTANAMPANAFATRVQSARAERVPTPPLACTLCDSREFVRSVLDELRLSMDEARSYHARIQEMSSQVLTAHEAERLRIARELHDDTAQSLTSIIVRLRLLERVTTDPEVLRNVQELREISSDALDAVRRLAMDLRPRALDDLGLVPALEALATKLAAGGTTLVDVSAHNIKRRLPRAIELVMYRVVQEALNNVIKHASARRVSVALTRRRNMLKLAVKDDGIGFEPAAVEGTHGAGLGLFGMRERLALVGGSLNIESSPGKGTLITACVPLPAQARTGGEHGQDGNPR